MKVNVKWNKETFNDVEIDTDQPPLVFKAQLFALSGVPPDRQKVMVKGGLLKDEQWGKQLPKEKATLMMMGTAEAIQVDVPADAVTFLEDLPESQQASLGKTHAGAGLSNLGNTCYMNSTVQCLYSVPKLKEALKSYQPSSSSSDPSAKLVVAAKELFRDIDEGGESFAPYTFLMALRTRFPQFGQQNNQVRIGHRTATAGPVHARLCSFAKNLA